MDAQKFFNLNAWGYDFITRQQLWRAQIASALSHVTSPLETIDRVLDLGCGPGVSSFVLGERLADARITGIDIADRMIARAQAHHQRLFPHLSNVTFEVADATTLPFDDETFDLAIGHSFLYLVPDRMAVLREIRRVLAPGATLVLMEPHRDGRLTQAASHGLSAANWREQPLVDVARFGLSMVLWRLVSNRMGQLTSGEVSGMFDEAGFDEVEVHPTLGGLGLHCVGRLETSVVFSES